MDEERMKECQHELSDFLNEKVLPNVPDQSVRESITIYVIQERFGRTEPVERLENELLDLMHDFEIPSHVAYELGKRVQQMYAIEKEN